MKYPQWDIGNKEYIYKGLQLNTKWKRNHGHVTIGNIGWPALWVPQSLWLANSHISFVPYVAHIFKRFQKVHLLYLLISSEETEGKMQRGLLKALQFIDQN